MRASREHMEKVRSHILEAAGQGFREEGYGGLGINGLAKRAGMTSGAFYGHFPSKDAAFHEVVDKGLNDYADTVERFKQDYGEAWPEHFFKFYLGQAHVDDLANSCVVPGLSADVMRADANTKETYTRDVKAIADHIAGGVENNDEGDALALMALMAGTVMMARCLSDSQLSDELLAKARHWANEMISK